jgi:molybdate transport system substrate-binding protein
MATRIAAVALATLSLAVSAHAAEVKVLATNAVEGACRELTPQFEKASGHKVTAIYTGTLDAQKRLAAGEKFDVVIMASNAIDDLIASGTLAAGSRVDLASSGVGVAVRPGAPKPDLRTAAAVKKALLDAKSIGLSTGPSGVYLTELFKKLGIAGQIESKVRRTPTGVFVGSLLVNGEVEIGFQQESELAHFPGISYVGPLPAEIQNITVFASGLLAGPSSPAAKAWVAFLTSPVGAATFKSQSMQPGGTRR